MLYRTIFFLIFLVCFSCTGSLTDEQRQQLQKEMEAREIKKISEGEIMEAALQQSRLLLEKAEVTFGLAPTEINTEELIAFEQKESLKLRWISSSEENLSETETQLVEAYKFSFLEDKLSDNLQRLGSDSVLYTKPVVLEEPEGKLFKGMWSLTMARKDIIRRM